MADLKVEPYAIERVESSRGTILYEAKKLKQVKFLILIQQQL